MKIISVYLLSAFLSQCSAFTAKPFISSRVVKSGSLLQANEPFFASPEEKEEEVIDDVEKEIEEELKTGKVISNLRNANGVDYAPWMKISAEEEAKIRLVVKDRAEARRKRQEQERQVSGALLMDSQAQELSGGGLQTKVIGEDVELSWGTNSESNTLGFVIKRRPAKTEEFEVIASYEDWGPLASKGPDGGIYRYLDSDLPTVGGWVYRITECEKSGRESDICQALVEIQTQEEQKGAVIAVAAISILAVVAFGAGFLLDPYQGL